MLFLLACAASEYQHTPTGSGAATGPAEAPASHTERPSSACGSVVMTGLDPCSTGEALEVAVSGLELTARYDLQGSACILDAGCDEPWLELWIVTDEQPCTWPGQAEPIERLDESRGYAVCLVAVPEHPGDIGACWLETSDRSYGVVVENPMDNG